MSWNRRSGNVCIRNTSSEMRTRPNVQGYEAAERMTGQRQQCGAGETSDMDLLTADENLLDCLGGFDLEHVRPQSQVDGCHMISERNLWSASMRDEHQNKTALPISGETTAATRIQSSIMSRPWITFLV